MVLVNLKGEKQGFKAENSPQISILVIVFLIGIAAMLASLDAALRPATAFRESTGTRCTHVITGVGSLRRMQCRQVVVCNAGFSGRSRAKSQKKEPKLARLLQEDGPSTSKVSDGIDGWIQLEDVHPVSSFLSKPIKPVILKTGRAICLYKVSACLEFSVKCET
jgi:hypothetical protein